MWRAFMIGLSHLALGGAIAACLAGVGGFAYGTRVGVAQEQAAQLRATRAADTEREKLQGQIDASTIRAQTAEQDRQSGVREIYHESQKIIERPVYGQRCVDADGVGLLDLAVATANAESGSLSSGPATAPANGPAD
jgi:hypothetical protein